MAHGAGGGGGAGKVSVHDISVHKQDLLITEPVSIEVKVLSANPDYVSAMGLPERFLDSCWIVDHTERDENGASVYIEIGMPLVLPVLPETDDFFAV